MKNAILLVLLVIVLIGCLAWSQPQNECSRTLTQLEQRLTAQKNQLWDWGGLIRYGSENTELPRLNPEAKRVVFFGDDVIEQWGQGFFAGKPYLNRGIAGQTTPQMLVRFRQDVIKLKPQVVVILAGTNDVASLNSPITQGMSAEYFTSMVELAKANQIKVILASITPICDCYQKQSGIRPFGKIIGLNNWLKDYAAQVGVTYLDFYSALAEGRNLKKEYTSDGLHLNDAAYAVMTPMVEQSITKVLSQK